MGIAKNTTAEGLQQIYCNGMFYMPVTLIDAYKIEEREKIVAEEKAKNKWLTSDEAAKYLNISKSTLYKYTHNRVIPYCKPSGKKILFLKIELDEYIKSTRAKTDLPPFLWTGS